MPSLLFSLDGLLLFTSLLLLVITEKGSVMTKKILKDSRLDKKMGQLLTFPTEYRQPNLSIYKILLQDR
jgi:hypothetical protein